jgi:hypothetical protein
VEAALRSPESVARLLAEADLEDDLDDDLDDDLEDDLDDDDPR